MYVCICKKITEKDLQDQPELIKVIGTGCGICKEYPDFGGQYISDSSVHINCGTDDCCKECI